MIVIVTLFIKLVIPLAIITLLKVNNTHYLGKRFLDFPQKNYCCYCCNSSSGCGIVEPDWMVKSNATFLGYEKLDAETYLKWSIKGLQQNLYYHRNDTVQTPRRLAQGTDDIMDFTSYKIGPVDPSIFKLPSYCTSKCGLTTICAALRDEGHATDRLTRIE